ncbi:FAD-dependent oxidoreductase [Halomonas sp. V046]|uniref:FAD-dependent oxidoreductase n=1 Tax=Halomonas sp. V046 TaxID=3459611 RepID=UPI004043EE1C
MHHPTPCWDDSVDLLVIGAGAGGMTSALIAALDGLDVALMEKTGQVGGITATSGGTLWIPGTRLSVEAGVPDTLDDAARFLEAVVGERGGADLRRAFLEAGPAVVEDLHARTQVRLVAAKAHPDYIGNQPGEAFGGRALAPMEYDGRRLGREGFNRVRPPRPEFMALGGMMAARNEIDALLHPLASPANFKTATQTLLRYAIDRLRYPRGTRLVMGNALVAQLLASLHDAGVPIHFDTSLDDLILEDGKVTGAVVKGPQGRRRVQARRGVVLATGGITHHPQLRQRLFPGAALHRSLAPETHTGDGIDRALAKGAHLAEGLDSPALWMPCSVHTHPDGSQSVWPHILLDRAKPGLIAVNAAGRRFVNESDSYHDFVMGMLADRDADRNVPAHLIVDRAFLQRYLFGMVFRGVKGMRRHLRDGYLIEARSLAELARKLDVDPAGLVATVDDYNRHAALGDDPAFGRGSSAMNRFNGDPRQTPNPCVRPLGPGPYYALTVWPYDLACSAGLKGDGDGRVLDADDRPIDGLYACGNDMASLFRGTYPGPGTTLGPALVMGWRVAKHAGAGVHQDGPVDASS